MFYTLFTTQCSDQHTMPILSTSCNPRFRLRVLVPLEYFMNVLKGTTIQNDAVKRVICEYILDDSYVQSVFVSVMFNITSMIPKPVLYPELTDIWKQLVMYNENPIHTRVRPSELMEHLYKEYKWSTITQQQSTIIDEPIPATEDCPTRLMYTPSGYIWNNHADRVPKMTLPLYIPGHIIISNDFPSIIQPIIHFLQRYHQTIIDTSDNILSTAIGRHYIPVIAIIAHTTEEFYRWKHAILNIWSTIRIRALHTVDDFYWLQRDLKSVDILLVDATLFMSISTQGPFILGGMHRVLLTIWFAAVIHVGDYDDGVPPTRREDVTQSLHISSNTFIRKHLFSGRYTLIVSHQLLNIDAFLYLIGCYRYGSIGMHIPITPLPMSIAEFIWTTRVTSPISVHTSMLIPIRDTIRSKYTTIIM